MGVRGGRPAVGGRALRASQASRLWLWLHLRLCRA